MRVLLGLVLTLLLAPAAPAVRAQAAVTVSPPSGPYGTVFEHAGTGLAPGTGVVAVVRDPTGVEHSGPGLGAVPPSGEWRVGRGDAWRAERGEPLGEYTVLIKTLDGTTVLVAGTFTVTGGEAGQASAPETLPRSGEANAVAAPLAGLGIALVSLGYALRRRGDRPSLDR